MSTDTQELAPVLPENTEALTVAPPRVARGLRFPVLPSGALLAQLVGGAAALVGTFLVFGAGVSLMVGGVAAAVLGGLREAGKI